VRALAKHTEAVEAGAILAVPHEGDMSLVIGCHSRPRCELPGASWIALPSAVPTAEKRRAAIAFVPVDFHKRHDEAAAGSR